MTNLQQSYAKLPKHFYAQVMPEPAIDARMVDINPQIRAQLGIDWTNSQIHQLTAGKPCDFQPQPIAQKYTGHQFGYYNPDLGDGRGMLLGDLQTPTGRYDLHLKGAGQTPFSRRGDGRAVLRSAVREYLIGEALHYLDVPSSRCLSLAHSPEPVRREKFEDRATYIRVAKTHIRFGHFEWLAELGSRQDFYKLADYVIESVYPELQTLPAGEKYVELLKTIVTRTASLIAKWQAVGFCHGVMNSDNMSVAGETFDFGPFAFLDDCEIHYICNHSDTEGRYAYSQQPNIGLWNCQVLAQAFLTILDQKSIAPILDEYVHTYNREYLANMGAKFGLPNLQNAQRQFIAESLILMDQSRVDFHQFFHKLAQLNPRNPENFYQLTGHSKAWRNWLGNYLDISGDHAKANDLQNATLIRENTAKLVLRNATLQTIIEQCEAGHYQLLQQTREWLKTPFSPAGELLQNYPEFLQPPPSHQKCLALSCSS